MTAASSAAVARICERALDAEEMMLMTALITTVGIVAAGAAMALLAYAYARSRSGE